MKSIVYKAVVFKIVAWSAAFLLFALFLTLVSPLVYQGAGQLSLDYLTNSPKRFGLEGGIGPILVSTFLLLVIAILVAILPSLATAFYLYFQTSSHRRWGEIILYCLKLLASIPSVVFGMFGMVVFCEWMGLGYSILSGGLTLAVMIIPTLCFSMYATFQSFPDETRIAAVGLSLGKWTQFRSLLLPHSSKGIAAGLILGVSRSLSETAALIFTSGYATRFPRDVFDSGRSLSIHIYEMGLNVAGGNARACAAAVVLLAVLVVVNLPIQMVFRVQSREQKYLIGY